MSHSPEQVFAPNARMPIPTVKILGVAVHRIDVAATLDQIGAWIATQPAPCRQICTVNPEFIIDARRNPAFADALRHADLRVPDGVGVLWAARLLGQPLYQRVTGSDHGERVVPRRCRVGREDPGPPEEARRRVGAHGTTVVVHGPSPGPNGGVASSRAVMPCTPPDRPPGGRRARSGRP